MTKKEKQAFRKAERLYWAKLGVDYDDLWAKIEQRYGHSQSITEFLFGTTILDTENKIIQYDTEKNINISVPTTE
jgi:hypothetical protein